MFIVMTTRFTVMSLALCLAACSSAPTQVITGRTRPAIAPAEVKIYSHPPPMFEEVALLNASTSSVFTTGGQKAVDSVIDQLKVKAAALGANGVILDGFSDAQTGSLGTGVGSDSYGRSSSTSVGVGGSLGLYKKTGQGTAIYVPPPPPDSIAPPGSGPSLPPGSAPPPPESTAPPAQP